MDGLTHRQIEIVNYFIARREQGLTPPTVREIGLHFGIASPNGVVSHLKAIHRKGVLAKHGDHQSRAWHLVEPPALVAGMPIGEGVAVVIRDGKVWPALKNTPPNTSPLPELRKLTPPSSPSVGLPEYRNPMPHPPFVPVGQL